MVRKTRKSTHHKKGTVATIPELRRSFEYMERVADAGLRRKESHEKVARDIRVQWKKTFGKVLDNKSALLFVTNRDKHGMKTRRTTMKGGAAAIAGAPLDYTTRQGMYLAPESLPDMDGHLPLTGGKTSTFGSYLDYVSKGFDVGVPQIAQNSDPVPGQTAWPVPYVGSGSNAVHFAKPFAGGKRNRSRKRKIRKGGGLLSDKMENMGAMLSQAFSHPIGSSAPPGLVQDMTSKWYGSQIGPSPDQIQRQVSYQLGSVYPKAVTM